MRKPQAGFTIVELLIVIVVIAIIAAITIVAYSGIQQRAKNSQTTHAMEAWVKALSQYRTENGSWPGYGSCLGEGYPYGPQGTDVSGGQCRVSGATITENATFKTAMKKYFNNGSLPTPALVTAYNSDTNWFRGLTYIYGGGPGDQVYIQAVFAGDVNPCPAVSGYVSSSRALWGGNTIVFINLD